MNKILRTVHILLANALWVPHQLNMRQDKRTDGQTKAMRESLANNGWSASYPPELWEPGSIPGQEDRDRAVFDTAWKALQDEYEVLKQKAKNGAPWDGFYLRAFQANRCDVDGNLIKPQYLGNSGNGRAGDVLHAMVQRIMAANAAKRDLSREDITCPITAHVYKYDDEADRIMCQQLENTLQKTSAPLSQLDELRTCVNLSKYGYSESHMERLFTRPKAQKYNAICVINREYPNLGLVIDIFRASDDPLHLKLSSLYTYDSGNADQGVVPFRIRIEGLNALKKGKELGKVEKKYKPAENPITEEEVQTYLNNVRNAVFGDAPKMMPKKEIASRAEKLENRLLQVAFEAVETNKPELIAPFVPHSGLFNMVADEVDLGNAVELEAVIRKWQAAGRPNSVTLFQPPAIESKDEEAKGGKKHGGKKHTA